VNKEQNNVDMYEKLIRELHARGIMVNASIVFGFDNDYPDVFQNTLDWLIKNNVETMTAHILTPYPGTEFYKNLKAENRIIDNDFSRYNTSNVVFEPKNMSKEELYNGYLWIYKKFYTHRNIIKRLPDNKKQWISYLLFNFGYRKYGKYTAKLAKLITLRKIGKLACNLSYGLK
jgi:radical SAM superfamily enzyme YgiQ (UPF0313 family)